MELLIGTACNMLGVASDNLAADLISINSQVTPRFDLEPVTGTFNVSLTESRQSALINELVYERNTNETLYFERCRLKWDDCIYGVKCLLLRSSIHKNTLFKDTLEIMSTCHLRDTYKISSGMNVTVEVTGDAAWWERPNDSL